MKNIEINELDKTVSPKDATDVKGGYYAWKLENVRVTSYSVSGGSQ